MEVKGIGQRIPKQDTIPKNVSNFEAVFDESKRKVAEPGTGPVQPVEKPPDLVLDLSKNPHLATNVQFVALQKWMEEFYNDLQARSLNSDVPEDGLHLKVVLYDSLKKLLREIVSTEDKVLQSSYLQRVHTWAAKRKERNEKKTRKELGVLSEKDIPQPKKYLVEQPSKKLYEEKMRTLHPEIPPPKERLADFHLKELKSEKGEQKVDQKVEQTEQKAETILPVPPIIQNKFPEDSKAPTKTLGVGAKSNYMYYEPKDPEEYKMERMWLAKKNKAISDKRASEEFEKIVNEWGFAKSRLNENVMRKYENVNFGNNFSVRNSAVGGKRPKTTAAPMKKEENDYEKIYDESSSEEVEEDSQQIDSPRKPQTAFNSKRPVSSIKPAEFIDLRNSVSTAATAAGNAIGKPTILPPPKTAPMRPRIAPKPKPAPKILYNAATAISESDKMRVDYIRRMYGHLIGETKDNMDTAANIFVNGPKGVNSLSLYNKDVKRPYTANPIRQARDLPITHQGNREQFRINQIKEINNIKEHLAKDEIPCSIVSLQRAILVPEDYPAFRMTAQNFMQPGSRLIVNPFAKKKKKKGKKKGKKSKK